MKIELFLPQQENYPPISMPGDRFYWKIKMADKIAPFHLTSA